MHRGNNKSQEFRIRKSGKDFEYIQEYKKEVEVSTKGTIRTNDPSKIYFDVFVIILAVYNCFGIPLEICLRPKIMDSESFFILNCIVDFVFAIDIYICFKSTYYDPLTGDEIFDMKKIQMNYLTGRFIVDFLSTVPFDTIGFAITQEKNEILPLFSLLKLIRVTRLSRIIERMNVKEHIKLMMKLA